MIIVPQPRSRLQPDPPAVPAREEVESTSDDGNQQLNDIFTDRRLGGERRARRHRLANRSVFDAREKDDRRMLRAAPVHKPWWLMVDYTRAR